MKIRILPLFAVAMIAASSIFSSCLKSDYEELDLPSASSISSFSLGTLYQTLYKGSSEGKDTIDTVSYAKHPFVIDQLNRKIYNPDSLPKGVDVSKALVNMSADGNIFYINKEGRDSIWSPADSLDLTKPLTLKVLTYSPVYNDFRFGNSYELKVNVHNLNPDSLVWNHYETSFASLTEQKVVYSKNNLYVFGKLSDNSVKVYKLNVEKGHVSGNWTELNISNNNINIYSALAYNNDVYYVAGGNLYKLSDNNKVGNENNLSSLISVSDGYMLAYTTDEENNIITLDENGIKGEKHSTSEFDFSGRLFAASSQAEHNSSLWRTTVMSYNEGTELADTTANIFSYTSSDEKWVKSTPNNPVTCPNLENISMVEYDGKLYAFGGKRGEKIKAFENFYYSNNYGFDWRIEPNKYMKFTDEEGNNNIAEYYDNKPYSCVVETNEEFVNGNKELKESFIWFVWHNGKVSRAHLNKFAPKTNPQN